MNHNGCGLKNVANFVPCGDNKVSISRRVEEGSVHAAAAIDLFETTFPDG
jgi:hypothetical protein